MSASAISLILKPESIEGLTSSDSDNLFLNLATSGTPIILNATQCRAKNVYLTGNLTSNIIIEFLNINRTWTIVDQTTRNEFTISVRKTNGALNLIYQGETVRFYATGS